LTHELTAITLCELCAFFADFAFKKEKVTKSYAENLRVAQRINSVVLCCSPDFLCVTKNGLLI
jgi:hypothetical protein